VIHPTNLGSNLWNSYPVQALHPGSENVEHLIHDHPIVTPRSSRRVKRMIRILEEMQCGARPELPHQPAKQNQIRECVARALQEQHRDGDIEQMRGAVIRWLASRVQWEAQEGEAADTRQWARRLRLRGHPGAERFAAGDERKRRASPRRFCDGRAHRRVGGGRRVGALRILSMYGNTWRCRARKGPPRRPP
jgi:hypothetical protein